MGIMDDLGSIGAVAGMAAAPFTGGMSLAPSLIAGGSSLLGSIFQSNQQAQNVQQQIAAQAQMQGASEQYNAQQAAINRTFQDQQAQQQMQFQAQAMASQQGFETQMSNTAYQRAVNDMKQAGLNPMMMFGSGGPESTPSVSAAGGASGGGSAASIGTPSVPLSNRTSALAGIGGAVSSAMDAVMKYGNLADQQASIKYKDALASTEASKKFNIELQNQKLAGGPGAGPTEAGVAETEIAKARATDAKNVALQAQHEYDARNNPAGAVADGQRVYSGAVKDIGNAIVPFVSSASGVASWLPRIDRTESTNSSGQSTFSQRYRGGAFGGLNYQPLDW